MEEPQQHRPRLARHHWRALASGVISAALALATLFGAAAPSQAIYNGTPIIDEPWAVRLTIGSGADTEHCTGELITTYAVLTAGHCFAGKHPASATATFHYSVKGRQYNAAIDVKHVYVHPQYGQPKAYDHDLAVAYLVKAVHETPLSLATADPPLSSQVKLLGYGCTAIPPKDHSCPGGQLSKNLEYLTLKIEYYTLCPVIDGPWDVCSYSPKGTASAGDSGGPVVRTENGTLKLVGVLSAYQQGTLYEDIFVSVPYEAKWIKDMADI